MTQTTPSTAARCAGHPDILAVVTCARCGGFLCGECMELMEEAPYCKACLDLLTLQRPPSRMLASVRKLGVLLWPCGFVFPPLSLVLGVACLVLSAKELRRFQQGDLSWTGLALARSGRRVGWFNLGSTACALLLWAYLAVIA
ncbi:hypothetical protein LY474_14385 [Myxococcus stipitatus]|uniref:hypothetical protein n=1 Tax=Myxococcus stipitatus TaxID=83455 RepID=UPI001F42B1BE|nr:hypothetical protein [Myxococcus stipitatus]MCE9668997.1 hypothetical protein [Myxococcus stipitatus]